MNTFTRIFVIGMMVVAGRLAMGQSADDFRLDVVPAKPFAKGTKVVQAWGSYTPAIRYSEDEFSTAAVGVGYYLFDNHSVNLVGHGFHTSDDADGGGVSFLGRSRVLRGDRWTFWGGGGGGFSWADRAVPGGGTSYDLAARGGLGAGYR